MNIKKVTKLKNYEILILSSELDIYIYIICKMIKCNYICNQESFKNKIILKKLRILFINKNMIY